MLTKYILGNSTIIGIIVAFILGVIIYSIEKIILLGSSNFPWTNSIACLKPLILIKPILKVKNKAPENKLKQAIEISQDSEACAA